MDYSVDFNEKNYKTFFRYDVFKDLSVEKRKELIKIAVKTISLDKGIHNVDVVFKKMPKNNRGSCSQNFNFFGKFTGHTMILNDDVLTETNISSPYSLFDTLNHELEHAHQFENASNRSIDNSNVDVLEQRLNDEHYYCSNGDKIKKGIFGEYRIPRFDSETDYQLYRAQACESDARQAGINAVEQLRNENLKLGYDDYYADVYIDSEHANEINENIEMFKKLGMHPRENLLKEELNFLPEGKLTLEEKNNVIEYARSKDFEIAKKVLNEKYSFLLDEENLYSNFLENIDYDDFFKKSMYQNQKLKASEKEEYKFATYKWNNDSLNETKTKRDNFSARMKNSENITHSEENMNKFKKIMETENKNKSIKNSINIENNHN